MTSREKKYQRYAKYYERLRALRMLNYNMGYKRCVNDNYDGSDDDEADVEQEGRRADDLLMMIRKDIHDAGLGD